MSLKTQVEGYTGTVTDTTSLDQWLTDGAKLLVDVAPEHKLRPYIVTVDVPDPAGVACDTHRIMGASLDGASAPLVPVEDKGAISDTNSLYKATVLSPSAYIDDGKIYIVPSTGTNRHMHGVPYPTVTNASASISGFPTLLTPAVILWAAIRVMGKKVFDAIGASLTGLAFGVKTIPAAPALTPVSYVDAAAAGISTVSWDAFATVPTFIAPTLLLPSKPSTFSIAAAAPGTLPSVPGFAYTPVTAQVVSPVTLGALGSAPTYVYGANNPLPAASTMPSIDFSSLTVPTAPVAPSFTVSDALTPVIGNVSIAALPTAPVYTYTSANPVPLSSTLTAPDFSGLVLPSAPAAPTFTYGDALGATIGPIVIGALPTAPAYDYSIGNPVPASSSLVAPDFAGLSLPSSPADPSFSYGDAVAAVVAPVAIAALPSAPTYVYGTDNPVPLSSTLVAPDFTGLTAPTAPTTPTFTYTDAVEPTVAVNLVAGPPVVPTLSYQGANPLPAASGFPTIDFTGITAPSTPSAPSFTATDALAAVIGHVNVTGVSGAPTFAYGGQNPLPAGSTLTQPDMTGITPPGTPSAPSVTYVGSVVDTTLFTASNALTTELTSLVAYLDTNQDIELAKAKIEDIQTKVQKYLQESELNVRTTLNKNQLVTDTNQKNAVQAMVAQVQDFDNKLKKYTYDLGLYQAKVEASSRDYQMKQADFRVKSEIALQSGLYDYNEQVEAYRGSLQTSILNAQHEATRVKEQAQLITDVSLKNEAAELVKQIQQYTATIQKYERDYAGYSAQVQTKAHEFQFKQADQNMKAAIATQDALARYGVTLEIYKGDLQRLIEQGRIDAQRCQLQAQIAADVRTKNEAQTLAQQIQEYTAKLQSFSTSMDGYKTAVQTAGEKARANQQDFQIRLEAAHRDALGKFNAALKTYEAGVQKIVEQARLEAQRVMAQAQMQTDLNIKNEVQGLAAQVQAYSAILQGYATKVEGYKTSVQAKAELARANQQDFQIRLEAAHRDALGRFNAALKIYEAGLQKVIEQARLEAQRVMTQAQLTTDLNIKNEAQGISSQIAEYSAKLQGYATGVSGYKTSVEAKAELAKANQADFQIRLAAAHQQALATFNADVEAYRASIQKSFEQAKLDVTRILQQAQLIADISVKNEAQELARQVQEYAAKLQNYATTMSGYQTQVQCKETEFKLKQADFQLKAGVAMQDALNTFNKDVEAYRANLQRVSEQAKIDAQKAIVQAQLTTDTDQKNHLQDVATQIQTYSDGLQRYDKDLQRYQMLVAGEVQVYQANMQVWVKDAENQLQKYASDIQSAIQAMQDDVVVYQGSIQKAVRKSDQDLERLMATAKMTTDVDLQNKAQRMAAIVASNKSLLEGYAVGVQAYQTDVTVDAQKYATTVARMTAEVQALHLAEQDLERRYQEVLQLFLGTPAKAKE